MLKILHSMKILISANVIWWNASAYYAVTTAQALARRGHDVTVLAHRSTPAFEKANHLGLKVIGDFNLFCKNPISFLQNLNSLTNLLKTKNFDVINPHRPDDHFYLALANRATAKRAKFVRTVSDVRAPKANIFNKVLHEKWTNGLIYCARVCRDCYHEKFQLDHLREKVIYSGLDVENYTRGDWTVDNRFLRLPSPRIGIVARLSPNKGHRTLIEAAPTVLKAVNTASFLVVGKEEEISIAELEDYAGRLGVKDAFTFTGFLDDPRPAIAACNVGVVASLDSEVISRAAQEFFAFGVPVVASRLNVLPEMIDHGVNGLLVNPGSSEDLAEAILDLLRSQRRRQQMAEGAIASVKERFNLETLGRESEAFFQAVLESEG